LMSGNNDIKHTYKWMDFTRWLAAFLVLVGHAKDLLISDYSGKILTAPFYLATGLGHASVMVFFVLSGFWITKTTGRRLGEGGDFWLQYLIDRLSRLWAVIIPAIAVGVSLDAIGMYVDPSRYVANAGFHSSIDVASAISAESIFGSIFFLQGLAVPPAGSNGPLWSVAWEFWYYMWLPAIWISLRRKRISLCLVTLIMAVLYPKLIAGAACWACGSALAYVVQRPQLLVVPKWSRLIAIPFFCLVFVGGSVAPGPSQVWDVAIAAAFAAALLTILRHPVRYPKTLKPLAAYGGNASFSLYAIHFPLLIFVATIFQMPRSPLGPQSFAVLFIVVLMAVLLGEAFSRATERKTGWLRRRLMVVFSRWLGKVDNVERQPTTPTV
jgi:peptidoglycan/LPS O-acetylase OafA/YrhL